MMICTCVSTRVCRPSVGALPAKPKRVEVRSRLSTYLCIDRARVISSVDAHVSTRTTTQHGAGDTVRRVTSSVAAGLIAAAIMSSSATARPEGVNRPELLPKGEVTSVIDVAGFLTPSEEQRVRDEVASLERDTGYRLRLLAQNYPETPGLAIKDYWAVDANTIVFVADPTFGDILNFNVGGNVDLDVPQSFWSRLAGKYGNKFFWQENGESAAILNAVSAIDTCLREEPGRFKCSQVQSEFGEQNTSGPFGDMMKGMPALP